MPALRNVKWERFCRAIVNGVAKQGEKFSQDKAYVSAGFNAKDVGKPGGSAEVCASKLLNRAKGNLEQYSLSAISALAERAVAALVPR